MGGVIGGAPHHYLPAVTEPPARQRVFVAARPPATLAERFAALVAGDPAVRPVPVGQLHVTLRFLAATDASAVTERLRTVALPAATATVGSGCALLGRDAVVLPVRGLDELAVAVVAATADLGRVPGQPFRGHLTLGRLRRGADLPRLAGVESAFAVPSVDVVVSELRHDGAVHTVVATLPTG